MCTRLLNNFGRWMTIEHAMQTAVRREVSRGAQLEWALRYPFGGFRRVESLDKMKSTAVNDKDGRVCGLKIAVGGYEEKDHSTKKLQRFEFKGFIRFQLYTTHDHEKGCWLMVTEAARYSDIDVNGTPRWTKDRFGNMRRPLLAAS